MAWDVGLLGDPVPEGLGKLGRPPHLVTDENRRKVMLLAAFDRTVDQIAAALSISAPTLRKHYFRELRLRTEARYRMEGKLLAALAAEADKGNVSAIDKMFKRLDRHELGGTVQVKPAKPVKRGKKEQAVIDAVSASTEGEWGSLLRH